MLVSIVNVQIKKNMVSCIHDSLKMNPDLRRCIGRKS